tara:strand:- start:103 stop:495 length:393 start_codon:yes stop_codon:yes gene_type:complete
MSTLPSSNCWANNKLFKPKNNITLKIIEKEEEPYIPNTKCKLKYMKMRPDSPPNKCLTRIFSQLKIAREVKKQNKFQTWLNLAKNDGHKIKFILTKLVEEANTDIKKCGYRITDENLLKNEIATFIYNQS